MKRLSRSILVDVASDNVESLIFTPVREDVQQHVADHLAGFDIMSDGSLMFSEHDALPWEYIPNWHGEHKTLERGGSLRIRMRVEHFEHLVGYDFAFPAQRACRFIRLRNDFHDTEVRLFVCDGHRVSNGQIKRARKTLCPSPGCQCAQDDLGTRGVQTYPGALVVYPNGKTHYHAGE